MAAKTTESPTRAAEERLRSLRSPGLNDSRRSENNYLLFISTVVVSVAIHYGVTVSGDTMAAADMFRSYRAGDDAAFRWLCRPSITAQKANIDPLHQGERLSPGWRITRSGVVFAGLH